MTSWWPGILFGPYHSAIPSIAKYMRFAEIALVHPCAIPFRLVLGQISAEYHQTPWGWQWQTSCFSVPGCYGGYNGEASLEKTLIEAIKKVIEEEDTPLHYTVISDLILSRGYYMTDSANPAAMVKSELIALVRRDGEMSTILCVGRGLFAIPVRV